MFQEALQYYTRLQQSGQVDSFEPFLLEPHGGDLAGFFLVRGDMDKLAQLRISDEFVALNTRAQLVVERFGVVGAVYGDELQRQFANFEQQIPQLA